MINLKDITKVPELTALDGSEKVILNVNGSAKQASVDLIKPAEEWDIDITATTNFTTDNGQAFEEPVIDYGSFDAVKTKILNGEVPKCRLKLSFQREENAPKQLYVANVTARYEPENSCGSGSPEIVVLFDNFACVYMVLVADGIVEYGFD